MTTSRLKEEMSPAERETRINELVSRLSETEAELQALTGGQIDAIVDPAHGRPILLRQAQDALRKSEARYQRLVSHISAIIFDVGPDQTILSMNEAVEPVTGFTPAELVGRKWNEVFVFGDELAQIEARMRESPAGLRSFELAVPGKDGSIRTLELNTVNHYAADGTPLGLTGMAIDRTRHRHVEDELLRTLDVLESCVEERTAELAQANAALRASEEKLRALFDFLPVGLSVLDQDRNILIQNPALSKILDLPEKSLRSGAHVARRYLRADGSEMPPEEFPSARAFRDQVEVRDVEICVIKEDGKQIWSNVSATPLPFADWRTAVVTVDITERKQAEIALQESRDALEARVRARTAQLQQVVEDLGAEIAERKRVEQQLRLHVIALEAAANGIIITDVEGKILWANPTFTLMTGHQRVDIIGQTPRILISGKQSPEFYERLWSTIRSGQVWRGELINRRKDGALYFEDQTITPVLDEGGQVIYFVAVKQDVTERKAAEQALADREALLATVLETLPVGVWIFDAKGTIIGRNPAARLLWKGVVPVGIEEYGVYKARWLGTGKMVAPEEWAAVRAIRNGETVLNEELEVECFDGSHKIILNSALPLRDAEGQITGALAINQDITRPVRSERELRRRNSELAALNTIATALGSTLQLPGLLRLAAQLLEEQLGLHCGGIYLLTQPDGRLEPQVIWGFADAVTSAVGILGPRNEQALRQGAVVQGDGWVIVPLQAPGEIVGVLDLRVAGIQRNGSVDRSTPAVGSEDIGLYQTVGAELGVAIQNAKLYNAELDARRRLQSLARRLVEVQENERRYVARELHDEAGQVLASLMVGLRLLERNAANAEPLKRQLAQLKGMAEEVVESLHRLAMDLRPASLDHLGLVEALRQYVTASRDKSQLNAQFEAIGVQERLPAEMETALYRIVQEAVANAVRHAKATTASVLLEQRPGKVILVVEDNGIGFDPVAAQSGERGRLGLLGIQERAEMLGGRLVIESSAGAGTTLLVEVPYESADSAGR